MLGRKGCFEFCDKGLRWIERLPEAEKKVEGTTRDGFPVRSEVASLAAFSK
jgi:hypothetical protein